MQLAPDPRATPRRRVVRARRHRIRARGQLGTSRGTFAATLADVSVGGAQLVLPEHGASALAQGATARLTVTFPGETWVFEADVRVVWVASGQQDHRGAPCSRAGVVFDELGADARERLSRHLAQLRPAVLLAGFDGGADLCDSSQARLIETSTESDARAILDAEEIAVLALGPGFGGQRAAAFLMSVAEEFPVTSTVNVVLAAGPDKSVFQDLVDADAIFYLTEGPIRDEDAAQVIGAAVRHWTSIEQARSAPESGRFDAQSVRVLEFARHLSGERDLAAGVATVCSYLCQNVPSDRAYVLFYEEDDEILWTPPSETEPARQESAAAGLTAFAVRTSSPVRVARVGEDSRYDHDADDPHGSEDGRLLAVPLTDRSGSTFGALVAVRDGAREEFTEQDARFVGVVAAGCAAALHSLLIEEWVEERRVAELPYRREALAHHAGAADDKGDLLRLSPAWTTFAFWILLAFVLTGATYLTLVRVHEYATGPAVVRFEDKTEVAAPVGGTVAHVLVHPGEVLRAGQPVVQLHDAEEAAEFERTKREFELQLAASLRDPSSVTTRQSLASVRSQRDAAEERVAQRTIRAPKAGIVSGVRVRAGQKINAGDVVLSLLGDEDIYVVAMLPGRYRAELQAGEALRFELSGYEHVYQTNAVESVGEVIGAAEALRYLGQEAAAPGHGDGPVVLVRARLGRATYDADGHTYRYHDGMPGTAEMRVRSERAIVALVPALRALRWGNE